MSIKRPTLEPASNEIDTLEGPRPPITSQKYPTNSLAEHKRASTTRQINLEGDINDEPSVQYENIIEGHGRFREDPFGFIKEVRSYLLSRNFRAYNDYIGKELFYPGFSDKIQANTLNSPLVQEKIKALVKARIDEEFKGLPSDMALATTTGKGQRKKLAKQYARKKQRELEIESWLADITKNIIRGLTTNFENKSTLKFAAFFTSQVLARTYHQGVHVNKDQVRRLLIKAKELEAKNQSLIFLPCHKSHIDYIVIHLLCFRLGISIPSVVAGDNLNFAFIGPALKEIGAMFIKRSISKSDPLYATVLQSYINTILSMGYNMECFIEGGRSRTGKLLTPKFGILKYILESVLTGSSDDVWIVPVSTQYDKVLETESYINELLGQEKKKESFGDFISARKILSLKMGRIDIRFQDPWSLKGFIIDSINKEYNLSLKFDKFNLSSEVVLNSNSPLQTTPVNVVALKTLITPNYHQHMLRSLGYKVLNDINKVSVIMPTALVGTILLTIRQRGVTYTELLRRVEWLIERVKSSGGRIGVIGDYENTHESDQRKFLPGVIDNALQVLGTGMVHKETKGMVVPIYEPKDRFQLSYYRNMVIHLFVSEGILCVGIVGLIVDDGDCGHNVMPLTKKIKKSDLIKKVKFISKLLSNEFIYEPEGININFTRTLENLKSQHVIETSKEGDDTLIWISPEEVKHRLQNLDFYCYLIWPFVEGFWLCGLALFLFLPYYNVDNDSNSTTPGTNWIDETSFIKRIQVIGKTLYHMGYLKYYESINKEILKNTLKHFVNQNVLVQLRYNSNTHAVFNETDEEEASSRAIKMYLGLSPDWIGDNVQGDVDNLMNRGDNQNGKHKELKLFRYLKIISIMRREPNSRETTIKILGIVMDTGKNFEFLNSNSNLGGKRLVVSQKDMGIRGRTKQVGKAMSVKL